MKQRNGYPRFHRARAWMAAALLVCFLASAVPALGERDVELSPLHYGQEAMQLHLENEPNTVELDGVTYTFEDDNVFFFQESVTVYGGKTRSVYEMTLPKDVWSAADAPADALLGTVTINPETKVTLMVGDGNRISGAYRLSEPMIVTDVYREDVRLPRDASGNPCLVDRIFLYSYSINGEEIHRAASVYFDYEDYAASRLPGGASASPEEATEVTPTAEATEAAPATEAPDAAPAAETTGKPVVPLAIAAAVLALVLLAVVLLKVRRRGASAVEPASAARPEARPSTPPVTEDDELRRLARRFEDLTARIQACVNDHPEKADQTRKFFSYYVPTAHRLLDYVTGCERAGVSKSELDKARATCRRGLEMACTAAQKHLDAMFSNEGLDADAEIVVMEQMLKLDGFQPEFDRRPAGKAD
ncbi:MAG: hypothetical protein Q4C10_13805 [Clostridia bacterium]|nr:hypothetical protein [Clostridia bacterium]